MPVDKQAIIRRLGGNEQLFESICVRLFDLLPSQLSVLEEAVTQADRDTLFRAAHRLKGSVAYFDENNVTPTLVELEHLAKLPNWDGGRARILYLTLVAQVKELQADLEKLRQGA